MIAILYLVYCGLLGWITGEMILRAGRKRGWSASRTLGVTVAVAAAGAVVVYLFMYYALGVH